MKQSTPPPTFEMTDQHTIETLLTGSQATAPESVAPDLHVLQGRVARRRRRKRNVRASALLASLACALASLFWYLGDPSAAETTAENSVVNPRGVTVPRQIDDSEATEAPPAESSRMRVFAKVLRPVPVFGLEQETQHLHLVGWIDSEEVVPVDLSEIPTDQQASIEAVLNENPSKRYFNL
jgi:hypothetical protein